MITSQVPPIDEPRRFEPHELFFSLTDDKGRIRYGNQVFTRVSGYEEEQLLGKPHNMIRHPHMPRCVFQVLWDYIEAGKTIAAYVKNLAADGRYYWVLAVVTPCRGGYLSVRLNPRSPYFEAAQELYSEVLAYESAVESDRGKRAAIEEATNRLLERLNDLGFDSYDAFMHTALKAELQARGEASNSEPVLAPAYHGGSGAESLGELSNHLAGVRGRLNGIFRSLEVFDTLSKQLEDKHEAMDELSPSLTVLALNANISATRLGDDGAVLSVVSRTLGERSKEADRFIGQLVGRMTPCCDRARAIGFEIAVAQLEAEVCESFATELINSDQTTHDGLVAESIATLTRELSDRTQAVLRSLQELWADTQLMKTASQDLSRCVSQMRFAQLNGKIDIASRPNTTNFVAIFDDVAAIIHESESDCDEITDLLTGTAERLRPLLDEEPAIRNNLCGIDLVSSEIVSESAAAL